MQGKNNDETRFNAKIRRKTESNGSRSLPQVRIQMSETEVKEFAETVKFLNRE